MSSKCHRDTARDGMMTALQLKTPEAQPFVITLRWRAKYEILLNASAMHADSVHILQIQELCIISTKISIFGNCSKVAIIIIARFRQTHL